jgi:transposase
LVDKISLKCERGRPRTRSDEINADSAYDSDGIRIYLRRRGIKSNIPVNMRNRKFSRRGRPTRFDEKSYRNRGVVERFNAWIESFKRILVRFERLKVTFMAFVNLTCIRMVLRVLKWVHSFQVVEALNPDPYNNFSSLSLIYLGGHNSSIRASVHRCSNLN